VEATAFTGMPCATPADAARCVIALHAAGAQRLIVSLGRDGLAFVGDGEQVEWPALPVDKWSMSPAPAMRCWPRVAAASAAHVALSATPMARASTRERRITVQVFRIGQEEAAPPL
jgi:hypothetical protein